LSQLPVPRMPKAAFPGFCDDFFMAL